VFRADERFEALRTKHEALECLFAIAAECARNRELSLILIEDQVRDIIAHAKLMPL
jgi:hypothetical protein